MKAALFLLLLATACASGSYDTLTVDLSIATIDCPNGESYSGPSNATAMDCLGYTLSHACPTNLPNSTTCTDSHVAGSCMATFFAGCFEPSGTCSGSGGFSGISWSNGTEIRGDLIRTAAGAEPCIGIYDSDKINFIRPR